MDDGPPHRILGSETTGCQNDTAELSGPVFATHHGVHGHPTTKHKSVEKHFFNSAGLQQAEFWCGADPTQPPQSEDTLHTETPPQGWPSHSCPGAGSIHLNTEKESLRLEAARLAQEVEKLQQQKDEVINFKAVAVEKLKREKV